MYRTYSEIIERVKEREPITVSVAVAHDEGVLEAVRMASEQGIAKSILVGNAKKIKPLVAEMGLQEKTKIIDVPEEKEAVQKAVSFVKEGQAQVLMKGLINSSDFLKVVLNPEVGLKNGRLLSHLAAFEIPDQGKIVFHTDGGMVISPNLEEKKDILLNAIKALKKMEMDNPKIAVLTANERVSPKMPSTIDAKALVEMRQKGEIPVGIIEGPISMDVAVNPNAANHKGIESKITGETDLFLVPNIEAGNMIGKTLIYYGHAKMAGLILGATNPIVMTSRAESAEGKLNSLALACLAY